MSPGAPSVFDGAMATPITRYATKITVIENATFTVLDFQFDATETQQANPNAPVYPALMEIPEVKRFQLATGSILVHFGHGK